MKIGLGTVQFGLDYGISNAGGITPTKDVADILALAFNSGIQVLDTASLYGSSEEVLGRCSKNKNYFKLVTKTPKFCVDNIAEKDKKYLIDVFANSLNLLGVESAYGLLIHDVNDLMKPDGQLIFDGLSQLKKEGLVDKIGVSVYSPEQLGHILDFFPVDIVQLPFNVFDQRFLTTGLLGKLKNRRIEVHSRSAFLQGLLLMETALLPAFFNPIRKVHAEFVESAKKLGLTAVEAALGYALAQEEIDVVICGVNTASQLSELIAATRAPIDVSIFKDLALADERFIDPSRWVTK